MDDRNQDSKRVEQLLTGGRSRVIRARSVIRPRGELPRTPPAVRRVTHFGAVLEQLAQDVPEAPWVVVVDGDVDEHVERLCAQAGAARPSSKFWVINSGGGAHGSPSPKLRLDPTNEADMRFIDNLVADLVIAPAAPGSSQGQRLRRWLHRARFLVADSNEEAVAEQLSGGGVGPSVAEVCVLDRRA